MKKIIEKNIVEINQSIETGKMLLDIFSRKWSFHTGIRVKFSYQF